MLALAESQRHSLAAASEDYITTQFRSFKSPLRTNTSMFFSGNSEKISAKAGEMLLKLKRVSRFPANWDSYGAEKPAENAVSKAKSFILRYRQGELPLYFLAPSPNGEILVELKSGIESVELFFMPDGSVEFVHFINDEVVEEGEVNQYEQKLFQIFG